MTDPHRGAYTPPTEPPLAFDARRPSGGRRPIPFALILSLLVLAAMIGAVLWFYRSGVRGADDAPQPVGTPYGEITGAAPAEAQPADPAAGLEIYKSDELGGTDAPTFAPPPEQPQPRPTTPVKAQPIPPVQPKATTPAPAPAKPAATLPANPEPRPAPGVHSVQIGALSTRALADKAFSEAIAIGGGGHGKSVTEVTVSGSTLYRTAVTGFASRDAAAAFCDRLKAAGKSCFVR